MNATHTAAGLIVAAGSSTRMGFDKMTAPLQGRPVVEWSLQAFQQCSQITLGVLVCAPDRITEFQKLAAPYPKFQHIVAGGSERSASVLNGLRALAPFAPNFVAVHDAARPLVTPALITRILEAARIHQAASAAQRVSDTLHRGDAQGVLLETVPREGVFAMQTPQAAGFDILLAALQAHQAGSTDEVSALIAYGINPVAILNELPNFKITYPQDLTLAEALLTTILQSSTQT
ncbi:MAG: 2-C-methyl-D-erythritol 4-phosphate cytidylyltransferase [Verrucomicrobia bacterium]|nr:2-C-methyl-D-erythritol 4-phosphate cytidylyltransferase [Verrucomicrobiota bacterium]